MGLFGTNKARITTREFKELRSALASKNFTERERDEVEKIFLGDMHESHDDDMGIDRKEADTRLTWMEENKSKHNLSSKEIEILREALLKYF